MKLFINARFLTQPISGVQRYAIECSRQIKQLYPECVFITPKNIIHTDIAAELGAVVIGRNTGHKWEQLDLPLYLWRQKRPKLLNLANTAPLIYGNNYVVIHDLAFFHYPEWNSKSFSTWYNILIPRIALHAQHIFTVSNSMKEELVKHYKLPAKKISVTYNGISDTMIAAGNGFDQPKKKIILSVGTFNMRKNQHRLVKAFLQSEIRGEYTLVLIGDKNKVFSESGIDEADLDTDCIQVHSYVTNAELTNFYRQAEVVVSLSEYEGFGIPVLEGLYFGCKVLCSDIAVYRELYDGYAAFCNPHDLAGIAVALKNIVGNSSANDETGINKLLEKYSYKEAAETIIREIARRER